MPTIRIDDEVFEALKKLAEPLVDTPNRVLRCLFGLDIDKRLTEEERQRFERRWQEFKRLLEARLALAHEGGGDLSYVQALVTNRHVGFFEGPGWDTVDRLRQPHERADRTPEQKRAMLELVSDLEQLWTQGSTEGPTDASERLDDYIYGPAD